MALEFDAAAYSVDAIQRAVYRLSDRLSADVACGGRAHRCTLYPADPAADVAELCAEFRNEVLDQVLRERIRDETSEARNLILALAFSRTGLVERADD